MNDISFKNEFLNLASKLDAVTNSCGEIVKIANVIAAIVETAPKILISGNTAKDIPTASASMLVATERTKSSFISSIYVLHSQPFSHLNASVSIFIPINPKRTNAIQ